MKIQIILFKAEFKTLLPSRRYLQVVHLFLRHHFLPEKK